MLLVVNDLVKSYEAGVPVVDGVDLMVAYDEIVALLGPSGCGKTTLLRMIAGFEMPDKGSVLLANRVLTSHDQFVRPQNRGVGFVFQDYALFPHMTALENVAFGLKKVEKRKRHVYAEEVLCRTGMGDLKHRFPAELSGGQRQRVALARAIAPEPSLVLLDEPFSNLDALLRIGTRKEVRSVLKKSGMSALLVTHDQEEALSFADRIAVMNEGRIEQVGTPEEVYYRPATEFVAQFLGQTNILKANAAGGREIMTPLGLIGLDREAKGDILCSIRPEHLTIEKPSVQSGGQQLGIVASREFKGHDITYQVEFGSARYIVHTDNRVLFEPSDEVLVKPLEHAVVLRS